MRLSEYASTQRTYGSRKVPRSVQQSIPIDQIYEDGTWRCGNVYSQMWSMPDINFTMSDEDNKAKILNLLGKVYMGVPSDCWLKICIVSQRMDEKSFRENVLLHRNLDGLDKWRVERNRRIRQCVQDAGNVVQHKYLILSTNKQNVTDARSRLRQVQGNLLAELSNLGCTIKPMTNNERLEVLHNFFGIKEQALLNNPSNFLPIYILTELWQTLGWNSIIYLSALSGIDQELYDAAKVDGANRWQQCLHVTLPGIAPTIVIMLILKMGKIFNVGYERVMLLYNPAIYNTADVINTYVYRKGMIDAQFSYSTAVGMFNCLVSFALVMITNKISQKVNGSGLW